MNIEVEKVQQLTADADKIFLTAEGEGALLQLLAVKDQVDAAIEEAKKQLEAAALKLNPNFKSIKSDNLKVYYREYGPKYRIDDGLIGKIPANLYTPKTTYIANAEEIEKFAEDKGALPQGIVETDRPKSLSFSRKGDKE